MRTIASLPGIEVQNNDATGRITLAQSVGAPTITAVASNMFAVGCILVDSTDGKTYTNVGSLVSPLWQLIGLGGVPSADTQAAWFIDPINGNDLNVGSTTGTALKTWAEVVRRSPRGKFQQATTFTIMSDLPTTDPLDVGSWDTDRPTQLIFQGTRTVILTGTITNFVARAPATNTPNQFTDTGVASFAPYVSGGYMLVMTSGVASGSAAFIAKDLGGNTARVTSFFIGSGFTEVTPNIGDTYQLVKLCAIPRANLGAVSIGQSSRFVDLDFYNSTTSLNYFSPVGITFRYCRMKFTPGNAGFIRYVSCDFEQFNGYGGFALIWAGMVRTTSGSQQNEIEFGQQCQIANGTLWQGGQLSLINGGFIRAYDMACFDGWGEGIEMHGGGILRGEIVWGSGNALYGVNVKGSGQIMGNISSSIVGASGAVRLHNVTYTWAQILATPYIQSPTSAANITPV